MFGKKTIEPVNHIFKIRVVYKSGYFHDFEVRDFAIKGGHWTWSSVDDANKPVLLNVDAVESVWQIGIRTE
jgi:hypothetical protein